MRPCQTQTLEGSAAMEADAPKKEHKKSKTSGQKVAKTKGKVERHNPRAFTFSGGKISVQRRVIHSLEKKQKKQRAPRVDKTSQVHPPPFVVVVQGPPGVGKSTLIQSLVKHYARQKLVHMRGPITMVTGHQRRLTIIECPQDMSTMLDLAKVADLVLCMIDASFGFELETFEFINILQVHGFPRVVGVLTHLDGYKDNKQLRKVKKTMKRRFWAEVFPGAKVFYLSGLMYGRYHRVEVQTLGRYITVQRSPILSWRQTHPYVLGLRWEDHTDPTLPETAPRRLDIYGYVYGSRLREGTQAHLAGVGDFPIAAVKRLTDPCPLPGEVDTQHNKNKAAAGQGDGKGRKNPLRTLAERHRVIYAPGSDIGAITVDSEAMYINVSEHSGTMGFTKREGEDTKGDEMPEAVKLVRALQSGEASFDKALEAKSALQLVKGTTVRLPEKEEGEEEQPRKRRRAPEEDADVPVIGKGANAEAEEDADDEGDEEEDQEESEEEDEEEAEGAGEQGRRTGVAENEVVKRARERFARQPRLEEVIYGASAADSDDEPGASKDAPNGNAPNGEILMKNAKAGAATDHSTIQLFDDEEGDDFVGSGGSAPSAAAGGKNGRAKPGSQSKLLGNQGDINGTDTVLMPALPGEGTAWDTDRKELLKARKFITGGWSSAEEDEAGEPKAAGGGDNAQEGAAGEGEGAGGSSGSAALATPEEPLEEYVGGMSISTFVRIRLEGVPAACVAELRKDRLLVLGGLLPGEAQNGLVQVRLKRHRWHPKLLKSGDAMLVSVGWRRFQTVPTFSMEDRSEKRMRFLKYSLEHAHCMMTMYGPLIPPNAGVMCFRSWKKVDHFRICGTGNALESAPNFNIVKKLKLVGEPYKIFKNTAFVKGMFSSDLEVSKYMHAKIQTVSGIRGEIKKAEGRKGGFRGTFEDRILMSDLVICKCWAPVQPKEFYHPVLDLAQWRPAKLIGELRANKGVLVPRNKDSEYGKQHVRAERKFNPLRIPTKLEGALPFRSKDKPTEPKKKSAHRKKAAVVLSDHEHKVNSIIERLKTVRKEKHRIRVNARETKKVVRQKHEKFIQDKRDAVAKQFRKERYIKEGHEETRKRKRLHLD